MSNFKYIQNNQTKDIADLLINSSTYWYPKVTYSGYSPAIQAVAPCTSNGWEQYDNLSNYGYSYSPDANNGRFIKKGYIPTFVGEDTSSGSGAWYSTGRNDVYLLTVASDSSYINIHANYTGIDTKITANRFRDGVVPKRMILMLQGAGGGGAYGEKDTYDSYPGNGGGAGAFCVVVISTNPGEAYTIVVGEGGAGGWSPKSGGDSYIQLNNGTVLVKAGGGAAGGSGGSYSTPNGENGYWWHLPSKRVGSDGTFTYNDSCYNGASGGNGGYPSNPLTYGQQGGSRGTVTTYTSFADEIKHKSLTWTYVNFASPSGGAASGGGGGASSFIGQGGAGGGTGQDAPGYGAGGGGGGFGDYKGGRGGNGWFALYY